VIEKNDERNTRPKGHHVTATRTLPDHATCATHQGYTLSCADYEELLAESKGGCFICGFPASRMPQRKLYIDHEGWTWAVRGLLCISCNSGLGNYHHPTPAGADEYLANAWYLRKLAERGLPLKPEEPTIGTIVRDHIGIHWHHGDGGWTPLQGIQRTRTWTQMLALCGPLNMEVIQVWDGAAPLDLGPRARRPPTKGALERRIGAAVDLLAGRDWRAEDLEVVTAAIATLTGGAST
jgi:hypothetical protein